ncbi:MAG: T9SS type A sorting domain-containing protein [Bacteroidales bacterium]|nr:T9SS type A sorting domain-containing protein [Bacteroidales bacterium]
MKKPFVLFSLLTVSFLFINWGSIGHYWINHKSTESFSVSMSTFMIWTDSLANHGSDADDRKNWDPDESMRHFINLDSYNEFNNTGHIPSTFDSAVSAHSLYFVEDKGILPWATKTMFDSLKLAFQQHNWHAAMLHASDLGHYVGDGHMPLHITKNYNGQMSGQTGIHSRYESDMIWDYYYYLNNYAGDTVHLINNVQQYILDYLYVNYDYVDSILDADTYAVSIAGDNTSTQYYQQLFNKTKNFTISLWENASHSLAELIYTAWVEAGSPMMTTDADNQLNSMSDNLFFYPNPVSSVLTCRFTLTQAEVIELCIYDVAGKEILKNQNYYNSGINYTIINFTDIPSGRYYCVIKSESLLYEKQLVAIH